jgi:hypothetical protein
LRHRLHSRPKCLPRAQRLLQARLVICWKNHFTTQQTHTLAQSELFSFRKLQICCYIGDVFSNHLKMMQKQARSEQPCCSDDIHVAQVRRGEDMPAMLAVCLEADPLDDIHMQSVCWCGSEVCSRMRRNEKSTKCGAGVCRGRNALFHLQFCWGPIS